MPRALPGNTEITLGYREARPMPFLDGWSLLLSRGEQVTTGRVQAEPGQTYASYPEVDAGVNQQSQNGHNVG